MRSPKTCYVCKNTIYAGVPARMIGKRKKEIIYKYEREMMEAV